MLSLLSLLFAPSLAFPAEFDLGVGYSQSRDFWETVHDVQDKTGDLGEIQRALNERYGRPDVAFSYLEASYSYPHSLFESETFSHAWIGTRAEVLAGGEVSNPIFPEIQAYANSTGIASYGFHSRPDAMARGFSYWSWRVFGGMGPEKRLHAVGPELIEAIPVRSGTLLVAGTEAGFLDQSEFGEDFYVTSNALLRPTYFRSSVPTAPSAPDEQRSFMTWRWRMQNEWLKEVHTPLSDKTRFGIITVAGQNPVPFTSLPVTWDYQQKLQLFPGVGASSGLGGILRLLTESGLPNLAVYAGEFGGGLGGGLDLQLGPVLLNGSTYALENALTATHDRTRLWQASLGVAL
jgi:hypothetical protein